jgi:hypothetical protein
MNHKLDAYRFPHNEWLNIPELFKNLDILSGIISKYSLFLLANLYLDNNVINPDKRLELFATNQLILRTCAELHAWFLENTRSRAVLFRQSETQQRRMSLENGLVEEALSELISLMSQSIFVQPSVQIDKDNLDKAKKPIQFLKSKFTS